MTPVTGTRFVYELDGNILTVQHERYSNDLCAGQNEVKEAWFKACKQLDLLPGDWDDRIHSGGWYRGTVKPRNAE